jgi:hypothetical protein
MDFFSKLATIFFSSNPVAVPDYLVERKLLPDSCECIYCNKPMILGKRPTKDTTDGYGLVVKEILVDEPRCRFRLTGLGC